MKRVIVIGLWSLAACGDDAESVDSNKTLGVLNASELEDVCGSVDRRFTKFTEAFVSVTCTDLGRKTDSCASVRQQCIDNTDPKTATTGKIEFTCQGDPKALTTTCAQITVGEMNACMNAILDGLESASDAYTCTADLTKLKPPSTSDLCTNLGARCPMFAEFKLD